MVYGWCASGRLPHFRLGSKGRRGCIRIAEADFNAFLATQKRDKQEEFPPPLPAPKPSRVAGDFTVYYQKVMERVARKRQG
jgi:hypothetical protein